VTTPLSFVSPTLHVAAPNITALLHQAARDINLAAQGYDLQRVSTHSLRASGAMALKLQGVDDSLIMKIGRWTGLTFLTYIHSQIGALNTGLAQRMATRIHFINVAG
jgi:integrase